MPNWIQWLLGIERDANIVGVGRPQLAATWAGEQFFWIVWAIAACILFTWWYYGKAQRQSIPRRTWICMAAIRSFVLTVLILTLCIPVLPILKQQSRPPVFFVLIDGTESMGIEDRWSQKDRTDLAKAVNRPEAELGKSRIDIVRQWLSNSENAVNEILQRTDCRIEAFVFEGKTSSKLRPIRLDGTETTSGWSVQLEASGEVTALGSALSELADRSVNRNILGTLVISDFSHNSGVSPLRNDATAPAARLRSPIFSIGIGATTAVDASIELQTDPKMKLAEESSILVRIHQSGLTGRSVGMRVTHEPAAGTAPPVVVREQTVVLEQGETQIRIPYVPQTAGLANFKAVIEPLEDEIARENNTANRAVRILDDYLRLMYVSHEPTWEWRFIKEVFHRDSLVGLRGFRTFLSSSDPDVRESNELFLSTMTPSRNEFFANDVIFLEDMPRESLTPRFCSMLEQFVSELGGGLVVMVGPRFGGGALKGTGIDRMLPVVLDDDIPIKDSAEFAVQRTSLVTAFDFMRLAPTPTENDEAWAMLDRMPWYQPVRSLAPDQASVLAEHPADNLPNGVSRQPLIAHRQFGKGQVVYLGFNETWRLRRRYGEKYYQQFWSQLIYQLGMSHALGNDKRFVPVLAQQSYEVEERMRFRVEAYDHNYQPLRSANVDGGALKAQLLIPQSIGERRERDISLPFLRRGVFETEVQLFEPGEYRIGALDPVTNEWVYRRFYVNDRSAETRDVVRNHQLQQELANSTGGVSFDLAEARKVLDFIRPTPIVAVTTTDHALWNSPLWFILLVGMLTGEWFIRKRAHLV